MINLGLVDDHTLFRQSLKDFLEYRSNYPLHVAIEASNGEELKTVLKTNYKNNTLPDLILMDIQMPVMDGRQATSLVKQLYPAIKIICLSQFINEYLVIDMLKRGADGFLTKSADLNVLIDGINAVLKNDIFIDRHTTERTGSFSKDVLSEQQIAFLRLCVSDLSYKEIAAEMYLSCRTVENYRDELFRKLNIRSRTGLALYAVKSGLTSL